MPALGRGGALLEVKCLLMQILTTMRLGHLCSTRLGVSLDTHQPSPTLHGSLPAQSPHS